MKKYLKKTMSITLAGMMLASALPAVNAAAADTSFAQPCVVDYFNSFNGYVKTAGKDIKTPTPEGFNAHELDGLNYRHQYLASGTTNDGANTYLKFTNVPNVHSGMEMKMDETINSGKLHISFDLKIDDLDTFHGFDLRAVNAANNNNVDDWLIGTVLQANNVLHFGGDRTIKLGTGGGTDGIDSTRTVDTYSKSWNKYDLIIDLDTNKMNFYINGTPTDENVTYDQDIKALMFFTSESSGATTTNMDNLFIKHYPDGNLGAPEMTVDYAGTVVPSSNATVYVGFSEVVVDGEVENTDFAAVNVATGNEIIPKKAALQDRMVKLTFDTLPAGKYEIKAQDTLAQYYTGKISKAAATVSNTFSVAGAAQNVKAENVLVSDDFENYNGGMPANAVGLYLDKTHNPGVLEKVQGIDGGNALKVTGFRTAEDVNVGSAIYKLPYAVTSGKLTYEFDINHANGMWFTSVLGAECFETDTYSKDVYDKIIAGTATDNAKRINQLKLRENTVAVGCKSSNDGIEAYKVQSALDKSNGFNNNTANGTAAAWTNEVAGLTLEPNVWNHVKVEIDIDNAVETITVGEGESAVTKAFKVYGHRFRPSIRYKRKTVNGTEMWVKTMTAGIQGISLGAFGDTNDSGKNTLCTANNVTYDNLKVYTDNSFVDYSDFNKQVASTTNTISDKKDMPPAGWVKQNKEVNASTGAGNFVSTAGKNNQTDSTDYAMQIKGTNALYSLVLSKPIPAKTAFEVSFDVKSVVPDANSKIRSAWLLTLQTEDQVYTTYKNSLASVVPFEAADDTSTGKTTITDYRNYAYQNGPAILGIQTDVTMDPKYAKMYLVGDDASRHYLVGKQHINGLKDTNLPEVDPTEWNHVSLKAVPQSNGTFTFTACLDNDNSKSITWSSAANAVINSNQAIHAIGLKNGNGERERPMTIDNFKVELLDVAPTNVYVTDVNAVSDANGEKTALSDGLAASGQTIEVNFSEPVASADAINVYKYDGTATTAVNATKALSADKKTATLTLSGIAAGDKLTLEVPNTIAPANNDYLSRVEATAVAFEVKAAAPEIKVEEFRLYKYYADGGAYASGKTSPACWAPATANDVANATAADKFKFTAKGYNTGKNEKLQFIRAFKDNDARLKNAVISDITLDTVGTFATDTTEFNITDKDGFINAYLWELSTLNPAYNKFNAALPATPAAPAE